MAVSPEDEELVTFYFDRIKAKTPIKDCTANNNTQETSINFPATSLKEAGSFTPLTFRSQMLAKAQKLASRINTIFFKEQSLNNTVNELESQFETIRTVDAIAPKTKNHAFEKMCQEIENAGNFSKDLPLPQGKPSVYFEQSGFIYPNKAVFNEGLKKFNALRKESPKLNKEGRPIEKESHSLIFMVPKDSKDNYITYLFFFADRLYPEDVFNAYFIRVAREYTIKPYLIFKWDDYEVMSQCGDYSYHVDAANNFVILQTPHHRFSFKQ